METKKLYLETSSHEREWSWWIMDGKGNYRMVVAAVAKHSDSMDTARLFIAAPELLAACKAAVHQLTAPDPHARADAITTLRAAIAKAEGK